MITSRLTILKRVSVILAITSILLVPTISALANVRAEGAGDVPFYAKTDLPLHHTDEWGVIVFYRPPGCIPPTFNLLDFFDIPGAFDCFPYTTDGFAIWKNGPEIDPAPIQQKLFGLGAVPVWFVKWPELESAIADGSLTITELKTLPYLIGYASFYEETLHPGYMIEFEARGILENGRTFNVHSSSVTRATGGPEQITRIVFR